MLAIARGLMAKPKLLLLDEPSLGLAPLIVQLIFEIIRELQAGGQTILLVEQNARQALAVSSHAYVMENGKVVLEGPAASLTANPAVIDSYLGQAISSSV
jgi:branched-chain amino acid transport system ATP-binding protein